MDGDLLWRFAWGAIGAAAPEVVRLYNIVTATGPHSGTKPTHQFSFTYFAVSSAFMGLGGALSIAWGDDNPLKCIWVGASVPVIVSSFAAQIPQGTFGRSHKPPAELSGREGDP